MKYKVTIEYAAFFEKEIDAKDEEQAEKITETFFEIGIVPPFCKGYARMHTEYNICEIEEIKD